MFSRPKVKTDKGEYLREIIDILLGVENWLIGSLLLGLWLSYRNRRRASSLVLGGVGAVFATIGLFPVGSLALKSLETTYAVNPDLAAPAGIILLGGGERDVITGATDQIQVNEAADRMIAAAALSDRFPDAKVFVVGRTQHRTAERFLIQSGVPEDRLIREYQSRNTYQNARLSLPLVQASDAGPYLLVTSANHMPRAMCHFQKAGWTNLMPYPVDFQTGDLSFKPRWRPLTQIANLNRAIQEGVGLLACQLNLKI